MNLGTPGREILGNIPAWLQAAMYAATLGAAAIGAARIALRARRWARGEREVQRLSLGERMRDFASRVLAQQQIGSTDCAAGLAHKMVFWGFLVAFLATVLTAVDHDLGVPLLHGASYLAFAFTVDLFGLLFLVGLTILLCRRWTAGRRGALGYRRRSDDLALVTLYAVGITGFLVEGARIAAEQWPGYERLSIGGWLFGLAVAAAGSSDPRTVHQALWAVHVVAVAAFFLAVPFSQLLHSVAAPANVLLRTRRLGELRPASPESPPRGSLASFSWKQLLDLDACTGCGRCSAACPATLAGKPLSPMLLLEHLREAGEDMEAPLVGTTIEPDEIWSCTTCGACEEACPVAILHIDRIVDLRRSSVERGEVPATAARAMESLAGKGNLWGNVPGERGQWLEALGVRPLSEGEPCETLYWIGCAAACDEQARRIAEATIRLLRQAGVRFGVLGSRERCSGDFARRVGDEGLFQSLAAANTRTVLSHQPQRIVTHCPHCLNAFRREYQWDGIEVVHHAAFLERLVAEGRLQPARPVARALTFHDPCYLTRYHGLGDPPRALLAAIPGCSVREMPRSGARALCCGGGGGQVLVDIRAGQRIPDLRFEEARATGAEWIATACPFCKIMLAPVPAERSLEGRVAVRDVAEVLAEACL